MTTRTEPTPQQAPTPDPFTLPWRGATNDDEGLHILSANDLIVCERLDSDDLLEFILNRVNSHAALVEALEATREELDRIADRFRDSSGKCECHEALGEDCAACDALRLAESALAAAKENA